MCPKDVKCYCDTKPEQTTVSKSQCHHGFTRLMPEKQPVESH